MSVAFDSYGLLRELWVVASICFNGGGVLVNLLEKAISIAVQAHQGQTDKAGAPYILHPLRVMLKFNSPEEQIAAVLHDIVEDTDWTLQQLRNEGFPETVIAAIDALTRRAEEKYTDFILRTANNKISLRVKLADLHDNCDISRFESPTDSDYRRTKKYQRAIDVLNKLSDPHNKGNI